MKCLFIIFFLILGIKVYNAEDVKLENLDFFKTEIKEDKEKKDFFRIEKTKNEISTSLENSLMSIIIKMDSKFSNAKIKKFKDIEGFYEVEMGNDVIYIHESGNYIIPLIAKIDGDKFVDIKEIREKNKIKEEIDKFPKESLISYMATNPIADIYVFSDYTCPYCKEFHGNLLKINNLGINVHYIPFPRNGLQDKNAINGLKNIICSKNPQEEFTRAFQDSKNYHKKISPLSYNCQSGKENLHNALIFADHVNVMGTPYIYSSNGAFLGGWNGIENFKKEISK